MKVPSRVKGWIVGATLSAAALCVAPQPTDAFIRGGTSTSTGFVPSAGWNPLLIGAGGWVRGIDIQCDQGVSSCSGSGTTTKVIRTDTYGAYLYKTSGSCSTSVPAPCWQQIVTSSTMPAGSWVSTTAQGVFEISIAPSNTQILYMAVAGFAFKSTNQGTTWTKLTGFSQQTAMNDSGHGGSGTNGGASNTGRFMVVSPADPNTVYLSVNTVGTFYTTNGGTTWTQISTGTIGAGTNGANGQANLSYFDPSDATGNTVYIAVYGTGVYKCTSARSTPSCTIQSTGSNLPTTQLHMVIDANGVVWVIDDAGGGVHKLSGGTWTRPVAPGDGYNTIAVDPANTNHVIAVGSNGVNVTNNGGTTFLGLEQNTSSNRTATDVPWLAQTNETFMTAGDAVFDMAQSNVLLFTEGIGVWNTPGPTTAVVPQWTSMSKGIEQLVAIQVIVPPGTNTPVVGAWDRPVFYQPNPNSYPSAPRPAYNTNSIMGGWALDYASSSPTTVVAMMDSNIAVADTSGTSSDGGNTWTQWGSAPGTQSGGGIAASNTTDFILCYSSNGNCYWTVDGAATWHIIDNSVITNLPIYQTLTTNASTASGNCVLHFANVPTTVRVGDIVSDTTTPGSINNGGTTTVASIVTGVNGTVTMNTTCATGAGVANGDVIRFNPETGWGFANFVNRQIVAADRFTNDRFYLYNYLTSPNIVGVYQCDINHAVPSIACTKKEAGTLGGGDNSNTKFVSMPGVAGKLFFTSDPSSNSPLQVSTDNGATWNPVQSGGTSFLHVSAIGFGNTTASPAWIAIVVTDLAVTGLTKGLYLSKDGGTTWTKIDGSDPLGNPAAMPSLSCDNRTPMACYTALGGGDGWAYYGGINWLLKRDLDPASNDNDPMYLPKAA